MRRWLGQLSWALLTWISQVGQAAPLLDPQPMALPRVLPSARPVAPAPEEPRALDGQTRDLIEAAIAADPLTTPAVREHCRAALQRLLQIGRQRGTGEGDSGRRAEVAFDTLHAVALTGAFDPHCARLQQTLAEGTYNCLTGTILYLSLCRDAGLTAVALASPGHVAVRIWLGEEAYDIETTVQQWLPRPADFSGIAVEPITDRALLGRVYYNLGVGYALEGNFELALRSTRVSCQLDPHHTAARSNLLATLNNWSIELARQGAFRHAESLIKEGYRLDASYAPLRRSEQFLRERQRAAAPGLGNLTGAAN